MIQGERRTPAPIRWAMVGGGRGSQVGYIHRSAALRDGAFALHAGAFDLDAARGRDFGGALGLAPERCYPDHAALFAGEARRADGIQAVSVATPNGTHFAITRAALEAGLLVCPMVIVNRMSPLTHCMERRLVQVKWIGMPNIILQRPVFPELIQSEVTPAAMAAAVRDVRARRPEMAAALEQLRASLGAPGAAERAADLALGLVQL